MNAPGTRVQAIHDIGVKVDDALEKAQFDAAKKEGIHEAYSSAASSLGALLQQVDKAHAGRDAELAKVWINKMITIMQNVAESSKAQMHMARGAEKQTREMVQLLKVMHDAESLKLAPPPPPPVPPTPTPQATGRGTPLLSPRTPEPTPAPNPIPTPPPPPPPVEEKPAEKKRKPRKVKQVEPPPPPPPPPVPPKRTRPISIKEQRNSARKVNE